MVNYYGITLNDGQKRLVEKLLLFLKDPDKQYFVYSGPAGSGKTTVFNTFMKAAGLSNNNVKCMAYVGKAAMVLMSKGLNASTIHAGIYDTFAVPVLDPDGNVIMNKNGTVKSKLKSVLKDKEKFLEDNANVKLIFVDEYSMLSDRVVEDILSFGIKVIFAGDLNQLPPVFGSNTILHNVDYELTEIMRQALDNPIIWLSQEVLKGNRLVPGKYGDCNIYDGFKLTLNGFSKYDCILCAKNTSRDTLNKYIRNKLLGITSTLPIINEKLICRNNNWDMELNGFYLVNGMIGYVMDISKSKSSNYMQIEFRPEFMRNYFEKVKLDIDYFTSPIEEKASYGISKYSKFEFGYCITVHLSQGSEYPSVLFINETFGSKDTQRRLQYTAITRARNTIDIAL